MAALLPRDPNWMFLYWEITPSVKAGLAREHGADIFEKSRPVARVYDASLPEGDDPKYFDTPIMLEAGNWYVHVQEGGRAYCCELGLLPPDGGFVGIVKSNACALPPGHVSGAMDEKWMSVSPDFDRLLQLSGVEYIGKGSGEVAKSLAQRWEMLRSVFSRAASWGVSSLSSRAALKAPAKDFRLAADCEIILYGATEPDAFVTVSGRKVPLNPDGTFSMRFALPDGAVDLPVSAMSEDETERREITISVARSTDGTANAAAVKAAAGENTDGGRTR
ncbi:MAG: hypothetical protein A2X35_00805 [Elusimicrobia bacterium GWA2_61_42]|nr:MAG: hypothetical protein A2X35_00805 [Elusimicrobia bacterium GWA2_61_42]OGR75245.1 MAG: hypothetical protein A2X38_04980 [Elusimicrobia bacterium GWC2_61_25]